jgi:hypothetical protein
MTVGDKSIRNGLIELKQPSDVTVTRLATHISHRGVISTPVRRWDQRLA